jgi:hypothetical protein
VDGSRAQHALSGRKDGKMTAELVNHFARLDYMQLWTENGLNVRHKRNDSKPVFYVKDAHVTNEFPDSVAKLRHCRDYKGPPVGVVFPRVAHRVFRNLEVYSDLKGKIDHLKKIEGTESLKRMAECAIVAGLEELDVLEDLCFKPNMSDLATVQELGNNFLTNPKRKLYNTQKKQWVSGKVSPNVLQVKTEVVTPDVATNCLVWIGDEFAESYWTNRQLVKLVNSSGIQIRPPEHILLLEDLPYRRGSAYVERALDLLTKEQHLCNVLLEEGVPSCGKTTHIKNNYQSGDLVVLPSREGALEYLDSNIVSRTIDSIVVNGWKDGRINNLFIDEGLKAHPGAIDTMMQLVKPNEVRVYGDRNQIPFIVRVEKFKPLYKEYPWSEKPTYHIKAYRNPKVICDLLRPLYPNGYVWSNATIGEAKRFRISSIEGVRAGYDVYLTYTQAEKFEIQQKMPGVKAMTIDESQGLRFERVALVRLKIYDLGIYNDQAQNIVAASRTAGILHYYSVSSKGLMTKWLQAGEAVPGTTQSETVFETKPYKFVGGNGSKRIETPVRLTDHEVDDSFFRWKSKLAPVLGYLSARSLTFVTYKTLKRIITWNKDYAAMPTDCQLQGVLDTLYHRRDDDIAFGERLDWPPTWDKAIKLDLVKSSATPALEPRIALHSRLKTPQPPRALRHPLDEARAFTGRVVNAPRQKVNYTPGLADTLVEETLKKAFIPEKIYNVNRELPIECDEMDRLWWKTRPGTKKNEILEVEETKTSGSKYYVIVRGDHKPKLGDDHKDTVPEGQLVTAMSSYWSSLFAPMFQTMLIKVMASLKPNIVFNTRMTWEELDATIDSLLTDEFFKVLELDIGKFDKSQDEAMLHAQCKMFKIFGMDDVYIDLWRVYHELCRLTSPKWGARYTVGHQRRSGDPLTWFGNTLVLLMILCYLYDIDECSLAVLGGDDNLCCFPANAKIPDKSKEAAEELNFELKPLSFDKSMYFSSRFVILTKNGWTTVPDPVKLIVRLGRDDIQGKSHLKQIHQSFCALHYKYLDSEVREKVVEAAEERYGFTLNKDVSGLYLFADAIAAIVADINNLYNLYYGTREEWNLTLDPCEKVGGGLFEKIVDVFTLDEDD